MSPHVRDRTKLEHVGVMDKVIWFDADQPVSILALRDNHSVIVNELPESFIRGNAYRFLGRWEEGKRGPKFRASTWVHAGQASRTGVLKYLADHCEGVGPKTAQKLWEQYGTAAVTVLRTEPQRVADDGVMKIESARLAAEELARFAGLEQTRIELFGLLAGRGFPGKLVEATMSKWGARAPSVIAADPFRLMTHRLPGCGWKRCDKMYLENGGRKTALKRQFLAGWNALTEDRSGSTWIEAAKAVEAIREAVPGDSCDPLKALKLGIRAGWLRIVRNGRERWIATTANAQAEQRVADNIRRLLTAGPCWPTEIPTSAAEGDGLPSLHQAEHLRLATRSAVGCFTGGPGSGKTHTLSFLLRAIIEANGEDSIAVAAPTGKAAVRASESLLARGIGIKATTIHRLLEVGRAGRDGHGWGFQRNAENPLSFRFLIVDEASMIDAALMASLLEACGTGVQVLFVGDTFQLPPVGAGAPLRDLIASGVCGVGELTEIRRNAGGIVRGCASIKAGQPVAMAARFALDSDDPDNLRMIDTAPPEALGVVEDVLRSVSKFDPVWDTQIITPLNEKSELSRKKVNERFAKLLNPDGRRVDGCPFAVGDKIICLKNSQLRAVVPIGAFGVPEMAQSSGNYQTAGKEVEFVANGEQGKVIAVPSNVTGGDVIFDFSGRLVAVPVKKKRNTDDEPRGEDSDDEPKGMMGDFDLAYCITVHKSQGSEYPLVIAMVDPAGGSVADRNFWYTAISRAKTACLLVGDRAAFVTQCGRQSLAKRKTFLAERLRGDDPESSS